MRWVSVLPAPDLVTGRGYLHDGERALDLQVAPEMVSWSGFFLTESTVRDIAADTGMVDPAAFVDRISELERDNARLRAENVSLREPWPALAEAICVATGKVLIDVSSPVVTV